jgi:hypothetical protein
MNERRYSYAGLGMLLGIFVGGGLAIVLCAVTGQAIYFAIVGIGLALGMGLGAACDGAKRSEQKDGNESESAGS